MGRKHKHPEHENLERWLVSYADFMTLLFATFTALYALAQTDAAQLKEVTEAIRQGFEEQSIFNGIKSVLEGTSPPSRNPDPIASQKGAGPGVIGRFDSMTYKPGEVRSLEHLVDDLTSDLKAANHEIESLAVGMGAGTGEKGQGGTSEGEDADTPIRPIEMAVQERGIRISFDSRLLFGEGEATVQPKAHKFLDAVAKRLKKFDNRRIHVEGHSDNQAISTAMFPSNWELSAARASSVIRYFIGKHQFNPSSMVAVGYGSTQPLTTNDTPEGRSKNRRVDIILYSEKLSTTLNPRVQFLTEKPVDVKSDGPDKPRETLPVLPTGTPEQPHDGLVKVIIKEADGTERVLVPKITPMEPEVRSLEGIHAPVVKSSGGAKYSATSQKHTSSPTGHDSGHAATTH